MENQQELMMKFQMFDQQIQQTQQQLQAVEQAFSDLGSIHLGLNELKGSKGKEIMAPIGKGIFAKATLSSEELIVDVGDKTFVPKSIEETQEMIKEQTAKLEEVKGQLEDTLKEINSELTRTMMEAQSKMKKEECCGEHENCECEEGSCSQK
ncbi:prefoldin subunit alpha [archaeon]|jgi:prefoldin alpha subunit|nr:prefoldin subunit alpha [archaeon]